MSIVGPSSIPPLSPELDPADYLPLDPPADELLPDMTPPPTGLIVGAVVGGLVLLVLGYCISWYRRRKVDNQIPSKSEDGISRPKLQPDEPKS